MRYLYSLTGASTEEIVAFLEGDSDSFDEQDVFVSSSEDSDDTTPDLDEGKHKQMV